MRIDPLRIFWTFNYVMQYAAFIVWTTYTINVVLGLIGKAFYKPKMGTVRTDKVELVLVSVASAKVRNALFETIKSNLKMFPNVPLNVVVDEGAELLEELTELSIAVKIVSFAGRKSMHHSNRSFPSYRTPLTNERAFTIAVVPTN